MRIHILGICGTFMGGIAAIAKALGYQVSGCDEHVYPPMSTQLEALGITLIQGYDPKQLQPQPDCVIIGNAMRRGNPAVEYVLDHVRASLGFMDTRASMFGIDLSFETWSELKNNSLWQ